MNKEVYIAYSKDNDVLYVGQGNVGRHKHCISGISHNKELNEFYFLNGKEKSMIVEVVHIFENIQDAIDLERSLIKTLNPKFNNKLVIKDCVNPKNFTDWSKAYYDAYQANNTDVMENLKSNHDFYSIVEKIGIDEIKATSFHKTKSKAKYRKFVGVESVSSSKSKAYKNLRIKEGVFYSYSDLKDKMQACFDKFEIKAIAKATDVKMVYNVKRTRRCGVEGYLIGGKL